MPNALRHGAPLLTGAILLTLTTAAAAQSTAPHWSTYFGGSGRDQIHVLRRGPGNLITVVGMTTSTDLPTGLGTQPQPPLQPAYGGGSSDVFVARIDPSQPPAAQIVWCTYLGGSGLDLAFDAEVDPLTGLTTIAGVTQSTDFPAPVGQSFPTLSGPSDGFVAVLDASGSLLLASMCVGGTWDDRLCEVELHPGSLEATVAGVTESFNLPATAGTVGSFPHGGTTDAFVARVDPFTRTYRWATYLGGSNTEGIAFANHVPGTTWEPNLDRMALALDDAGRPVLATVSFDGAVDAATTPGCMQPTHAGAADVYVAILDLAGTPPIPSQFVYATFCGGSLDDRPQAIARHPDGGFVVAGYTLSSNFPLTANCWDSSFGGGLFGLACDGFVTHIDPQYQGPLPPPGRPGLRYATLVGGAAGEDAVMAVACESSGLVTLAGYCPGNLTVTPRCHQDTAAVAQYLGAVVRLAMRGNGAADLLYGTYVGGAVGNRTLLVALALDDVGDVFVAGETQSASFPLTNAIAGLVPGGREGAIMHLPLLPGGVFRDQLAIASTACTAPIYTGAGRAPVPGDTFTITATNAPPGMPGLCVLGTPASPVSLPAPLHGTLAVAPAVTPLEFASATGHAYTAITLPPTLPALPTWGLAAQWFFFTSAACPGTGPFANSERLAF
jgi:hypothetical protein